MSSELQVRKSSCWVRKRSDIDIIANILSEARRGARKTRIMYRCNLSHRQLEGYLGLLLDMGFLESNSNSFGTTSKGRKFLDAYGALKALMV